MSSQSMLVELTNCRNSINLPNYQNLLKLSKTDPYGSHRIDAMDGISCTDTVKCMDGIPTYRRYVQYIRGLAIK